MREELTRSQTRVLGFPGGELDFQLLRQLGSASYGGASVGEGLWAAAHIRDLGVESWPDLFASLGDHQQQEGEQRAASRHRRSARDLYLMASNSYRAAEYFAPIEDPRHTELGLRSRDAFRAAMQSSDWLFEPLEIVVEISGCLVTAWRRKPRDSRVLLAVSGFDGTLEETYLQVGVAGLQRGLVVGRPAAVVRSFRDHHSGDARGRGLLARFPRGRTGRPVRARPACARAVLSR